MKRLGLIGIGLALLVGCTPTIQSAQVAPVGFTGPRLQSDAVVADDGARLPLMVWSASTPDPEYVIIAVHGMNDSHSTWALAGPWWAEHGVTTYAYDQRGFGGAPNPGVWAGEALLVRDLRTTVELVRARHPSATIGLVGESLGSAVIVAAMASEVPPEVDRVILTSPAVWGWSSQAWPNRISIWIAGHLFGAVAVEPPEFATRDIWPSDNLSELYRMARDPDVFRVTRFDTLYGLVDIMQTAAESLGQVKGVPLAYMYGARDQVVTIEPTQAAIVNLPPGARTIYYPQGRHLLTRDHEAELVMADVLSFMRDPTSPWPSGFDPIPGADRN